MPSWRRSGPRLPALSRTDPAPERRRTGPRADLGGTLSYRRVRRSDPGCAARPVEDPIGARADPRSSREPRRSHLPASGPRDSDADRGRHRRAAPGADSGGVRIKGCLPRHHETEVEGRPSRGVLLSTRTLRSKNSTQDGGSRRPEPEGSRARCRLGGEDRVRRSANLETESRARRSLSPSVSLQRRERRRRPRST